MTWKKRFLRIPHIWFLLFLLAQLLPNAVEGEYDAIYAIVVAAALEVLFLLISIFSKKETSITEAGKLIGVVEILLIAWLLFGQKWNLLNERMFPPPGIVFHQFAEDALPLLSAIGVSMKSILIGFVLAIVTAVPIGLILGWFRQVRSTASYVVRFVSAIPPIVYIPYAIALLPTISAARIFIIFIAAYWPILSGTMTGVMSIERGTLDSAKALNVNTFSLLTHVIFPGALPYIFNGANQGIGISFILLTSAEMIAADSTNPGLGFYIWNYSNFANYKRVIPAILCLGTVICLISFLIKKIQDHLLRWKP